jgi:hypothetical protein
MNHISPVIWQFLVKWLTNFALLPPEASKIAPQMDALLFFMVLVSLIGLTIVVLLVVELLDSLSARSAIRWRCRWRARRCWKLPGPSFRWGCFW